MFIEKCYFYHLSCSLNRMILQRYTLFIYYTSFLSTIFIFLTVNVCAGMSIQYATLSMAIIVSCLKSFGCKDTKRFAYCKRFARKITKGGRR